MSATVEKVPSSHASQEQGYLARQNSLCKTRLSTA